MYPCIYNQLLQDGCTMATCKQHKWVMVWPCATVLTWFVRPGHTASHFLQLARINLFGLKRVSLHTHKKGNSLPVSICNVMPWEIKAASFCQQNAYNGVIMLCKQIWGRERKGLTSFASRSSTGQGYCHALPTYTIDLRKLWQYMNKSIQWYRGHHENYR